VAATKKETRAAGVLTGHVVCQEVDQAPVQLQQHKSTKIKHMLNSKRRQVS
jgi:hypothetical protein